LRNLGQSYLHATTEAVPEHSCRYFAVQANDEVKVSQQVGVIRTNCMDNLDRTNVVQATLAKYMLNKQLVEIGVLQPGAGVDDYEALSKEFRESTSVLSVCAPAL
jgi:hypothetical protein